MPVTPRCLRYPWTTAWTAKLASSCARLYHCKNAENLVPFSAALISGRTALPRENLGPMGPESILDPAVGAGDLLLEAAWNLPAHSDPLVTLQWWSSLLHGRDKEPDFVRLAKARLVLLAVSRGSPKARSLNVRLDDAFPEIRVGDGLDLLRNGWTGNHIVMNPPYAFSVASSDADWSSGKTSLGCHLSGYSR